jgi:3-oxoacyl-[acyl-carrier-protein] synthase II
MTGLRPTLYLGQLSNLLAGNISIVHAVTGSSRTFKGEEMAGVSALENAVERIQNSETELVLVGGALNAEREDLLLGCELEHSLYRGPFKPVWERRGQGGGAVLGSVGVFLLVEAASHARSRGAQPYARIDAIHSGRSRRQDGETSAAMVRMFAGFGLDPRDGALAVMSGASGIEPATTDEQAFFANLRESGFSPVIRTWGSLIGHAREVHFLVGIALAAMSVAAKVFYPPFGSSQVEAAGEVLPNPVLVTTLGSWRGEAMGLVSPAL